MSLAARLAHADPIYARIWRAVPRSVDPALRDDIMSEIYLAIREGRLHPRDIPRSARLFINAGFAAFASRWGTISLDAMLGTDDDRQLVELIEDTAALAAFDQIRFERETRL